MRISDWSSDVCSSDLIDDAGAGGVADQIGDLLRRPGLGADRIADVGAIEPGDDQSVVRNPELIEDVGAGMRVGGRGQRERSEEHTSELQSLMRISYAVFCLKKKKKI